MANHCHSTSGMDYVLARMCATEILSTTHSVCSRFYCREDCKFAVQRNDDRCVQQQFRRRFLGRNCRHRRLINITSVPPFAEALLASDRKAPIIIHSSLNRPPTRQLRLPVGRVYIPCILTTFPRCTRVLRSVNICSGITVSLEKQHSQITNFHIFIKCLQIRITHYV